MIRRARPEDVEAVVRISRESRAEAMPWLPVVHTAEEDAGYLGRALAGDAYVLELEGEVAGYAILEEGELHDLYVAPEAQGKGVGSALFHRAQEERPAGFHLWVFQRNERARRFYEARGCRLVRETDGAGNEERTPDALYECLPSPEGAAA